MDMHVTCRKCGCCNAVGQEWGPHTYKIKCPDCNAVTWGKGHPSGLTWKQRAIACLKRFNDDEARNLILELHQE